MMIEIGGAQLFSVVVMVIAGLVGMWTRRVQSDQKENAQQVATLKVQVAELREQLAREASDYARRSELEALMRRIEEKLDRMTDKLDSKQDKQA
ncbi:MULTISPECIES: hypothetical protein [Achromobacter]|uniref:hypothetical protein n=1 Tax=Achromobacter TaxID=222 RepID=UPI0006C7322A|nr:MULTISPECIES: hypothetical protein [Achromobacter]MCH4573109.1 hypothetical protein [Achromobacter xylosoxidans]PWY53664.1 hypothetical protein DK459_00645 [Achromobacter sp. RW408]CUJ55678.1 Uncharacterised protein [Achromobacter sp. 2789STDY5608621]